MTDPTHSPPPNEATHARVHLVVTGRVQGVYFRASAADQARALGLAGWVRNRLDGAVEAVAEGPRPALERFVAWCHGGPPAAHVDSVETAWGAAGGEEGPFAIRR
jgi:acylphosphatase